ncbi:pitrilysin family protein [Clostridium sp. BSD9I1]|uniref:M16 family metallopeptidase n=1 Tax=Clostridium sp. BSD9I1 TaxID=2003589 RepID=UPI0016472A76|nr:pitrilysin family protein [Clostridium sp. BSD9I1]
MIKEVLKNGLKVIYKYVQGNITSFCIGVDAGAIKEEGFPLGTAHAVEHMVFKGTINKTELEINKLCDELFGFQNAMTNYPYVVYYGSLLNEDFEKGLGLFSDIVLRPTFPENGFKEEMDIIKQELNEWSEDLYQFCEDELLHNAFQHRRIKDLIIGTHESISKITLNTLKDFYNKYYLPSNMVVTVVTGFPEKEAMSVVEKCFDVFEIEENVENLKNIKPCGLEDKYLNRSDIGNNYLYENNNAGMFVKFREGVNGSKIQYAYPIHNLSLKELGCLKVFNNYFGEGTSSILYDTIRTQNGLSYEIESSIKEEKGIRLFKISMGTSGENIEKAVRLIDSSIEKIKQDTYIFNEQLIKKLIKNIELKTALRSEKSVQLAKDLACSEIMYSSNDIIYKMPEILSEVTSEEISRVINKVLNFPTIQIIK